MANSGIVRAKAPLRLSFAGGGTDVAPFPELEGGAVLSATITRYTFASLRPRPDRQVSVTSLDFARELEFGIDDPLNLDGDLDLPKAAVHRLLDRDAAGFDLFLTSNVPPGSGLGSSSSMMVALVGLLAAHYGLPLTDYEIASMAAGLEREDLGIRGGLQDFYAATFGGFNYIEFESDRVVVNPLHIAPDTINELEATMLLVYTGQTRLSDHIISDQTDRYVAQEPESLEGLRAQRDIALAMRNALLRQAHEEFGALLHEAWVAKRKMSPRISTPEIDEAYDAARRAGALGGKVTGAGGGGFMVFACPFDRRHLVAEKLTAMGLVVTEFAFTQKGLTTWRASG